MKDPISPYINQLASPTPELEFKWRVKRLFPIKQIDFENLKIRQSELVEKMKKRQELYREKKTLELSMRYLKEMQGPSPSLGSHALTIKQQRERALVKARREVHRQEQNQIETMKEIHKEARETFVQRAEEQMAKKSELLRHTFRRAVVNQTRR